MNIPDVKIVQTAETLTNTLYVHDRNHRNFTDC